VARYSVWITIFWRFALKRSC